MREIDFEERLDKYIRKLKKKDKKKFEIVYKKVKEIAKSPDIEHYKNLRSPLNEFKRVHIDRSFVLVFKYYKSEDKVVFYDLDHHDKIYSKKYK